MIAKDGLVFAGIAWLLTLGLLLLSLRWDSLWMAGVAALFSVLSIGVTFFFRDPDRTAPTDPHALISPADGRIVAIVDEPHPFVGPNAKRVSIFLSVFDVHINRVPAAGVIDSVIYRPGEFFAAWEDKASHKNEQTEISMRTLSGQPLIVRQIAGFIARRIICRLASGQAVNRGDRFGLIRFGSRTDLIVPAEAVVLVQIGDRVRGGETVLARLSQSNSSDSSQESEQRARL